MVIKTLKTRGKNLIPHLYLELVLTDSWQDIVGKEIFHHVCSIIFATSSWCSGIAAAIFRWIKFWTEGNYWIWIPNWYFKSGVKEGIITTPFSWGEQCRGAKRNFRSGVKNVVSSETSWAYQTVPQLHLVNLYNFLMVSHRKVHSKHAPPERVPSACVPSTNACLRLDIEAAGLGQDRGVP